KAAFLPARTSHVLGCFAIDSRIMPAEVPSAIALDIRSARGRLDGICYGSAGHTPHAVHQLMNTVLLYEEVWAEPTQQVAKRYGVSDVAIAKACALLDIPKPPRGYWAKKAAGQKLPHRPSLPK